MSSTWVLVANSSFARCFEVEKNGNLKEISSFNHPQSRLHERDLGSDRPGRAFESSTIARHAIEPETSLKTLEFVTFAKELSHFLSDGAKAGKYHRLYIAANPQFLGLLRPELSTEVSKMLITSLDKDMTQMTATEIRKQLPY